MSFFGKKPKLPCMLLTLYTAEGEVQETALNDLALKDEVVVAHSIKFFSDPAPCYIHKGAVCVRLLAELEEELALLPKGEKTPIPEKFSRWVKGKYLFCTIAK